MTSRTCKCSGCGKEYPTKKLTVYGLEYYRPNPVILCDGCIKKILLAHKMEVRK